MTTTLCCLFSGWMSSDLVVFFFIKQSNNFPVRVLLMLIDEIFDLKEKNQWIRQSLMAIVKTYMKNVRGDSMNKKIKEQIADLVSAEYLARYFKNFRWELNWFWLILRAQKFLLISLFLKSSFFFNYSNGCHFVDLIYLEDIMGLVFCISIRWSTRWKPKSSDIFRKRYIFRINSLRSTKWYPL